VDRDAYLKKLYRKELNEAHDRGFVNGLVLGAAIMLIVLLLTGVIQ